MPRGMPKGRRGPLRKIVQRDGTPWHTIETLECGHLAEPVQDPVYPERHLHARKRYCRSCLDQGTPKDLTKEGGPIPVLDEALLNPDGPGPWG